MTRVTWLQHRFMVLGTLGLFGCLAAYILFVGPPLHALYSQYVSQGCPTPNSANVGACVGLESQIQHSAITITFIDIALHVLPVVLGMFVGAIPTTPAATSRTAGHQAATAVIAVWRRIGLPVGRLSEQVVFTPACGLAGASPAGARAALARCQVAARLAPELIEEGLG